MAKKMMAIVIGAVLSCSGISAYANNASPLVGEVPAELKPAKSFLEVIEEAAAQEPVDVFMFETGEVEVPAETEKTEDVAKITPVVNAAPVVTPVTFPNGKPSPVAKVVTPYDMIYSISLKK